MSLQSGTYIIRSVLDKKAIGRHPIEDRSLLPKPVRALPSDVSAPKLVVQKVEDGYHIRAKGDITGRHDGQLYAFLIDAIHGEAWRITEQPQHGKNIYIVETNDREAGWSVPVDDDDKRGAHVNVRPLIVFPTYPPRFPDFELFEFVRIDKA
ncbi:hypothetical protein NLI96_g2532 [Meripilus lineatus]|uniref:Uncharacterized protein n=1 Tax=Meripilus lineatus TaxID=2056292 RepID=A0AAD5V872_9APHY|nr:hypothetical protein NLI96_g2532 [Physisporinus lineatus]